LRTFYVATLQKSWVDIHQGDKASQILYQAARKTWKNRSHQLGEVITRLMILPDCG